MTLIPTTFKRVKYFVSTLTRELRDEQWVPVPEESDTDLETQVNVFLKESRVQLDGTPSLSVYPEAISATKRRLHFLSAVVYLPAVESSADPYRSDHGEETKDPASEADLPGDWACDWRNEAIRGRNPAS